MFEIDLKPEAISKLRSMRRYYSQQILDAIERHLRFEPERTSRTSIKRLRGKQEAAYRLRVGEHRVFYEVKETTVEVLAILHKSETSEFYAPEEEP